MLIQLAFKQYGLPMTSNPTASPTPTIYMQQPTATATPTPSKTAPTSSVIVTKTPTPTTTTMPTPTKAVPTATPTVKPTSTPQDSPTNQPSDHMAYIMNEINKYRASQGLSEVKTSTETCDFAAIRAKEIVTNFNHDGFQQRIDAKTIPYKSWTKITENIAMTSDYTQVVTMWKNSPGHAANMRADTPYVCVRNDGSYYAYEGMKP